MSHASNLERLRHYVRTLEILHKEKKLKARRLALRVAYLERALKATREVQND